MDASTIGFLKANRHRLRILETLKSKAAAKEISHKLHIGQPIVDKSLKELEEHGLIKAEKKEYFVTEEGIKILAQVSRGREK